MSNNTPGSKVHFTETLEPYGELQCRVIYVWYDGPIIYVLENDEHRLFVYWFDGDEHSATLWYLPISAQVQEQIDAHTLCLRSVLMQHPGEAVRFNSKTILERTPLPAVKPFRDDQLPEAGLYLTPERIATGEC